jgi:5-methyltetrahydrofolate--homocysteine methyltransferase
LRRPFGNLHAIRITLGKLANFFTGVLKMADLQGLADAVIKGNQGEAVRLTQEALDEGLGPKKVLEDGLIAGMNVIGVRFKANEVYIPEVLISARAMKMAMEILEPQLAAAGVDPVGKALIGTVQGDLHDIGKNLVVMMLKGAGFHVEDIGVDVAPDIFVEKIKDSQVSIVGLSALLTTTMPAMEKTVQAIREAKLGCKIMIGGAPVTQNYADTIGADGYAADAASAVDVAKDFLN